MTLTRARTAQYIGILFSLMLIAVGYWYFAVRAGVKTNTAGSQGQGNGLDASLNAYWRFDENTGTSTTDASTNGATGTLTNGPAWTAGQIGYALDFDGTNDYVTAPDADVLELTARSKFVIAGWFNRDTFTTDDTIVAKRNGITAVEDGYIVYIDDATDQLIFEFSDGVDEVSTVSTTTFTATGWHHFVITQVLNFGDGNPRVYIDGQIETSAVTGNINDMEPAGNALAFRIGAESDAGNPFDGKLDEIRYYHDKVLSPEQVTELYRLTAPTGVDTSLKGYWAFDGQDTLSYATYDWSGAGNVGTIFGTGTPPAATPTTGRVGQALRFDGTDDYIQLGSAASLDDIANMTTCIWAKPTGATDGSLISKDDSATGWNIVGNSTSLNSITFYKGWTGGVTYGEWRTSDGTFPNNQWSHVCVTYSNSSTANDPIFYINGVSVPFTEVNAPAGTIVSDATFSANIGSYGSGLGAFFSGGLDEARIYNRILTAAEIKSLYNQSAPDKTNTNATQAQGGANLSAGLALYWPFDEGSGTNADDKGVGQNDGTLTNGPTWTTGQIGSAVDFDGTNDYVAVADPASGVLDFALPSDNGNGDIFNVSLWYNRDTATTDDTLIAKKDDPATGDGYVVYIDDADDKIYAVVQSTTDTPDFSASYSTTTYTSSGWRHLVVTFDEFLNAGGFFQCPRIYVDGVDVTDPASCANYMHYTGSIANALAFTVGAESDGGNPFDGKIDDVRVYTRPLTKADIELLYRGTSQTSGVDTGLRGYWSLDAPDTARSLTSWGVYDRSGWGNWGTVTNSPVSVRGRVGQAVRLDGANDHISIAASTPLNNQHTFTYAAWIYPTGATCGNGYGRIIEKGTGSGVKKSLYIDCGGLSGDRTLLGLVDSATTDAFSYTAPGVVTYNQWQHVAMTYDDAGDRKVRLYINGQEQVYASQVAAAGTVSSDTTDDIAIGATPGTQFYALLGMIDEPRIYSRVITTDELRSLYAAGAPDKTNTSVSTPQGTGRLDSGLMGYWKLDETTGSTASDSSTNGTSGTLTNMENGDWTTGRIGNGLTFDGTNEYVSLGDPGMIDGVTQLTVTGWAKSSSLTSQRSIITKSNCNGLGDAGTFELTAGYTANTAEFCIYPSGGTPSSVECITAASTMNDGNWHFLTGVYDGATIRIYMDAQLSNSAAAVSGDLSANAVPMQIGACNGTFFWNDMIDEVRVYDRALSVEEIQQLYSISSPTGTDTGLKGYWSFNGLDMNGTTALDRSGAGNDGTLTNGPVRARGKLGQGLSFDGTNDYVTMGDINAFDGITAMTASAWVKTPVGMSAEAHIIDKAACTGIADTGTFELWHSISDSGRPSFTFYKNGGSPADYRATSSAEIDDDQWHLVTGTYDGTAVRIYVDGVQTGSTSATSVTSPSTANAVEIGGNCNGGTAYPWPGSIDEVRIYTRALSASEVKALYDQGR